MEAGRPNNTSVSRLGAREVPVLVVMVPSWNAGQRLNSINYFDIGRVTFCLFVWVQTQIGIIYTYLLPKIHSDKGSRRLEHTSEGVLRCLRSLEKKRAMVCPCFQFEILVRFPTTVLEPDYRFGDHHLFGTPPKTV